MVNQFQATGLSELPMHEPLQRQNGRTFCVGEGRLYSEFSLPWHGNLRILSAFLYGVGILPEFLADIVNSTSQPIFRGIGFQHTLPELFRSQLAYRRHPGHSACKPPGYFRHPNTDFE